MAIQNAEFDQPGATPLEYENQLAQKRDLYPLQLAAAAYWFASITLLSFGIMHCFKPILQGFRIQLPVVTQWMLQASDWAFSNYYIGVVTIGIGALLVPFVVALARHGRPLQNHRRVLLRFAYLYLFSMMLLTVIAVILPFLTLIETVNGH